MAAVQMQNQLMAPIVDNVQKTVEKLAKEGGYIYVFDVSSLLYFDSNQSKDLTPDARKALNIPAGRTLESLQAEMQAQQQATIKIPVYTFLTNIKITGVK